MNSFKTLGKNYIESLIGKRNGETKLGETIVCVDENNWEQSLKNSKAKFVLLGIPEDIGVRANFGAGGTRTAWEPSLKAILNVQQSPKISGENIIALGFFDLEEWSENSADNGANELRALVSNIDDLVYPIIQKIVAAGKIPIVIGGGHNNAYPILKGVSKGRNAEINCVNLDAHPDYRLIEGRHSGNGFRYAKMDGYLKRYAVIGLHENYSSENMLEDMKADKDICYYTYEDIFLHENIKYKAALDETTYFVRKLPTGVELDLDCITNVLSSAATPCGVTPLQARKYISHFARFADAAYLHITEGAVRMDDGRENVLTAKLIAYMVTDFIKGFAEKHIVYIDNDS